uniref:Tetraspanin n=1 Tax=Hirondellea gigas TaxID=1518452 RepID=A0A2P2HWX8_9CRUS
MGFFSKFFLFVLNFIVFAIGVGVIVLASLILTNGAQFQVLLDEGTFSVPIILLIMGVIVMLIGFFGCFGALRESPCLLYTYATIVLLLLIAQISVAIYGIVKQDELKAFISGNMVKVFEKIGGDDQELTDSLNGVQHELHCCGVYNYTDWALTIHGDNTPTGGLVPSGCCKTPNSTECTTTTWATMSEPAASEGIYTKGCYTLFMETIEGQATWLGIGAILLALIQLFCVLVACGIGKNSSSSAVY